MLANVLAQWFFFRIDLTEDKRYSLSETTKAMLRGTTQPVEATLYLAGGLNSGFLRLQRSTRELLAEMAVYGPIRCQVVNPARLTDNEQQALQQQLAAQGLAPTAVYETDRQGRQTQTLVYPYAHLQYGNSGIWVSLLQNRRGASGAENLNSSVEGLEYAMTEALHELTTEQRPRIAFLEGHGELPEQNMADIEKAIARHTDIYRGSITPDAACLDDFAAVVIADPQLPFSEHDKFVLDQYLMQGGKLLWCLNGVRFSAEVLSEEGFTPVLPLDLHLTDMLFRYGVRINPHIVQDRQCLPVPVDVSRDPERPQWQPMPWYYNPLLLTNSESPVTRNLTQVSAPFASDIDFVGEDDNIGKTVLLATSDASHIIAAPAEVNLGDLKADLSRFTLAHIPVAVALEGVFPSLFTHRMVPAQTKHQGDIKQSSVPTRQVVVAAGSIPRNELQQGQPLPAGYDRYSRMQFGNRDFIVNALLWLTDENGLLDLRRKTMPLRLLNDKRMTERLTLYCVCSTLIPLLLLGLTAFAVLFIRRKRYTL